MEDKVGKVRYESPRHMKKKRIYSTSSTSY